jgi:hypothetical protein
MRDPAALRRLIRERLCMTPATQAANPAADDLGVVRRSGYSIRKLLLHGGDGVRIPMLYWEPDTTQGRIPGVLYCHEGGLKQDTEPGGRIEALVKSGQAVLDVAPRGFGVMAHDTFKEKYPGHGPYNLSMRAMLVGKTLIGLAVEDLIRALDYLASRDAVDPKRLRAIGVGNGGVAALYTAALDTRVETIVMLESPVSYRSYIEGEEHTGLAAIVVPGVLKDFDLPDLAAAVAPRRIVLAGAPSARRYWPARRGVEVVSAEAGAALKP